MTGDESHLGESVGPDVAASREERNQTDVLVDVLNEVPELTEREFRVKHEPRQHDGVFADEWNDEVARMKNEPVRAGLPGFGNERPDCGVQIPHICEDCGHRIDIGRTCAQSRCPRCAQAWVTRRAPSIVARILSAAKMKDGSQKFHHVSVDAPDLLVDAPKDKEPEDVLIDRLQEFCRRIQFDGAIFYHPYRGADVEGPGDGAGGALEAGDDRGEWKKRLFNGRDWDDVRDELKFSPHFHLIGCAEWFPGGDQTRRIYDETKGQDGRHGWLFNRITPRGSARSINGVGALARAVCYCMSHVGIDTRGERDTYVHGKVGAAYHNAGGHHHQKNERIAEAKVRDVAPDVLGVESSDIECRAEVVADDAGPEEEHDHELEATDADGDEQEEQEATAETTNTAPCRSGLTDIDDADFVEDRDWQMQALYAEEAVEAREEWKAAGGWQGWKARNTGQTTLPNPPDAATG